MKEYISISDAIKLLRIEIEKAQRESNDSDLKFNMQKVEVELAMVFKKEGELSGSAKAWFLNISGKSKSSDEATHKVKLTLEPTRNTQVKSNELEP